MSHCAAFQILRSVWFVLCVPFMLHFSFLLYVQWSCVSHLCYMSIALYVPFMLHVQLSFVSRCAICPMFAICDITLCVPYLCCMSICVVCPVFAACDITLCVPFMLHVTLPCVSHLCCMSHSCCMWHYPVCPIHAACDITLCVPFTLRVTLPCVSHSRCVWHYPVCPIHAACDITLCVPCTLHVTLPCVSPPMEAISFVSILWMCCGVVERELRTIVDNCCVRCEVLTVLWQRIEVLWDVMLCRWVSGSWYYRGILLLNCWSAEGEGTLFVQNIKNHSSINCVISWQILKLIQILLANILTLLPISGAACQYLLQTLLLLCSWVWFSQQ